MNRTYTEKSVLRDIHFWKGAGMFTAGCLVMGAATSFATSSWLSNQEQPYREPIIEGELGAEQALALWAAFPVAAEPRPVVIVGPDYRSPYLGSDDGNLAFSLGRWTVPKRMTLPPRSAAGYAIRYVGAALEELRADLEDASDDADEAAGLTLGTAEERAARPIVSGARLDTASFTTDRGVRNLPAWVVNFRGQERPLVMLAVASPNRFAPRTAEYADSELKVSRDGLKLTWAFPGAPPGRGPCEAEYQPVFQESATAVAVGAQKYLARAGEEACPPATTTRTVSIQLARPLGDRVVVTARYGAPMTPVQGSAKAS